MIVGADLLRDDTGLIAGLVIGMVLVNRPPRAGDRPTLQAGQELIGLIDRT